MLEEYVMSGYRRLLAGAMALALAAPAWAQSTGTIAGRVIDRQTQRPLASVQVRIVGTTRGAQTDEGGNYRLVNVAAGVTQLAAQRIGYGQQSRTVNVGATGTTTADFEMTVAVTTLDQVVVTATGQSERRRESGVSTATIDSGLVNKANVSTLSDVLSSRAPGVVVQISGGETGAGSRVRIRGSNSISLNNDPLLIVDGIRVDNSPRSSAIGTGGQLPSRFNDINPEEIENIEIIKGPAAAALYGTAAANGVIQITTKKGRAGKTHWDTFGELGNLKDVNDYPLNYRSFGHRADGTTLVTNCSLFSRTSTAATHCAGADSTVSNLPLTAAGMIGQGSRGITGLSAAGGSDLATYFLAGEYQKEQNVIPINNQQRLNLRTNVRGQLAKNLDAQVSIGYTNSDLRRPQNDNNAFGVISGSLLGKAVDCGPGGLAMQHPTLCSSTASGVDSVSRGYYNPFLSPSSFYNINTRQQVQRITGSMTSNWTPLSWLVFNGTFGADIDNRTDSETLPPGVLAYSQNTLDGYRGVYRGIATNYTTGVNGTATYDFKPTLRFTTTLGTQYVDELFTRTDAYGAKLLAGTGSLAGTNARFAVSEQTTDVRTLGYLGREQMAWRDRVFLTAGIRTDRNSAFGQDYARIYYPSLSGSWVLSEERFFPATLASAVSSFRLRAAVGSAGQSPGYLTAEQYYNPVAVVVNGTDFPGFTVGGAGNPSLKPERSTEYEGGFDLGLFHDRVNAEYTYYNKTTRDALVNVPLAPSLGSSATQYMNLGRVKNWGHEALVRATAIDNDKVKLDLTVNGSWNSNVLDTLGYDPLGKPIPPIYAGFSSTQIIQTGQPLGAYWGQALTGYNDANGDGLIGCPGGLGSPTCEITLAAQPGYLGSPFPSSEVSFTPALSVGNLVRVTATLDHRGGQKLFNNTKYYRDIVVQNSSGVQSPSAANLADQAAAQATNFGSLAGYIENASFTKLREVAVTLTLPKYLAARANAGSASLTLAGRNLHTWTSYTGMDPEVNAVAQSNFSTADFLTAPQVRYFTARLALSF
jgi:TonB-linked SusC/RagA family outer membrane protein